MEHIANPEFRQMLAERIRALADPTRIHLLHFLMQKEYCVHELAQLVEKSQATVSKHLAILTRHGFITKQKHGVQTFYRVENESLKFFCQYMCDSMKEHIQHIVSFSSSDNYLS